PAFHLSPVQGLDGCLSLLVAAHLHKAESLGSACVAVHDYLRRLHGAVRLEQTLQIPVTNAVGQIAYVQLLAHRGPPEKNRQGAPHTTALRRRLAKYTQTRYMGRGEAKEWRKTMSPSWRRSTDPSANILPHAHAIEQT